MSDAQYSGGAFPTDKQTRHYYLKHYADLYAPYHSMDINILEVGVKMGGSIALWREFFSNDSYIYGLDIEYTVPMFTLDPNIKVLKIEKIPYLFLQILILDSRDSNITDILRSVQFDIIVRSHNLISCAYWRPG